MNILRKILKKIFSRPILWAANRFTSSPHRKAVFDSLSDLLFRITTKTTDGKMIPFTNADKFIIVSDQHKGGDDFADDFRLSRTNYLAALDHYFNHGYTLFNLGDCEELWENTEQHAIEKNREAMLKEAAFCAVGRYYRTYGNHDLNWKFSFPRNLYLKPIFGDKLDVCEGFVLTTTYLDQEYKILLTHGHQGDTRSDGNRFSTWFVAAIWTPIQRFLQISINTISDSYALVDKHNRIMYEWSSEQTRLILVTGHTHKPVFASLDHIERLESAIEKATADQNDELLLKLTAELEKRKFEYAGKAVSKVEVNPSYFNSGCCCFSDGDITAIEIDHGEIRLVKWEQETSETEPVRKVLESTKLEYIFDALNATHPSSQSWV